jgi:hypothetical protein
MERDFRRRKMDEDEVIYDKWKKKFDKCSKKLKKKLDSPKNETVIDIPNDAEFVE